MKNTFLKQLFVLIVLFVLSVNAYAKLSIAILPIENQGVDEEGFQTLSNQLFSTLVNSGKFKIVERSLLKKVIEEQKLGMSGMVDAESVANLGKLVGANKIIKSKVYMKGNEFIMQMDVLDVNLAVIEYTVTEESANSMNPGYWAGASFILRYPLFGDVIGVMGSDVIISIGKNDGLNTGQVIFWVRENIVKDETGHIIWSKTERLGKMRIKDLMADRALVSVIYKNNSESMPAKGDLVSPEPIPLKDPVLSGTPYHANYKLGNLILDDDMAKVKYLAPSYNTGEAYVKKQLSLDASNEETTMAYAFYPPPYDSLSDYVIEGEITYVIADGGGGSFIALRSNRQYSPHQGICFAIADNGKYDVYYHKAGSFKVITGWETSPALNRDKATNSFKIVAIGDKFDFYINNKFVVAFEDENYESGGIGLWADSGDHVYYDNIKVWEVKK